MYNISTFEDNKTANTKFICALQRAENLAILGCKNVLELCVGPSLKTLYEAYKKFDINVVGNDIDIRWKKFYPSGNWIIDDAKNIDTSFFDATIFAPPLTKHCSGKREDSLSLTEVVPSYYDYLNLNSKYSVYVLPGKTLSIKEDRKQLYKFLANFNNYNIIPLKNKVIKYIDIYVKNE